MMLFVYKLFKNIIFHYIYSVHYSVLTTAFYNKNIID